jgi:hypothetical protein
MEYEPDFFDEDENRVEPWRIGALGGSRTHDLWLRRPGDMFLLDLPYLALSNIIFN